MSNAPIPTLRLSMRTITPVCIGSDKGDQLSPYADYIFSEDGKQLHYLNLRAIERAFEAPGMHRNWMNTCAASGPAWTTTGPISICGVF